MDIEELKKENDLLRKELGRHRTKEERKSLFFKTSYYASRRVFLGRNLENISKKLFKEVVDKNISTDTLGGFVAAIFRRLIRVGFVGLIFAMLPTLLLIVQSRLIQKQNDLFEAQNKRILQQNYLQEAQRRSSLNFLLGNIFDKIDEEVKIDTTRKLSPQLTGRIIALTHSLKPYYFLDEGDTLVEEPLSPERGQLLIALINSDLDSLTYKEIFGMSNFSKADLKETSITSLNSEYLGIGDCRLDKISLQLLTLNVFNDYEINEGFLNKVQFQVPSEFYSLYITNSSVKEVKIDSFGDFGYLPVLDLSGSFISNSSFECNKIDTLILDSIYLDWETTFGLSDPARRTVFELDGSNIEININQPDNLLEYLIKTDQVDKEESFYRYSLSYYSETDSIRRVYFEKI